jgi:hypothetical protein
MANITEIGSRSDTRHSVSRGRKVSVIVESCRGEETSRIKAELIDISRGGIRLRAESSPMIHEVVTLRFSIPESDADLELDGSICWARPINEKTWGLGCAIHSRLPDEIIRFLAAKGYVQRRCAPRQPIDHPGTIRWEATTEDIPVRVRNLSSGGFCLTSSQAGRVGERLLLEVPVGDEATLPIVARAEWQLKASEEYKIGCAFVRKDGLRAFRQALKTDDGFLTSDAVRRVQSNGTLLGLMVILLITLLMFLGIL